MHVFVFSLIVCLASILAGPLGALTALGGGVVIVAVLCLLFKVDLHYAIGASPASVILTSSVLINHRPSVAPGGLQQGPGRSVDSQAAHLLFRRLEAALFVPQDGCRAGGRHAHRPKKHGRHAQSQEKSGGGR